MNPHQLRSCIQALKVANQVGGNAIWLAQRDVDTFMASAGPTVEARKAAVAALRAAWEQNRGPKDDPALISHYLDAIERNLGYEAEERHG
jgi:hypothetical protein